MLRLCCLQVEGKRCLPPASLRALRLRLDYYY